MAYTPFALLAAVIIVSMAFTATNSVDQDPFSQEYMNSIEESWEITQTSYAINSADILAEKTLSNEVDNFGRAAENLSANGTYQGVEETENNYRNWSSEVLNLSSGVVDTELSNLTISTTNLSVETNSQFKLDFDRVNYTIEAEQSREIYDVKDPILENIESRNMTACSYTELAKKQFSGSDYNGTARGKPAIEADDVPGNNDEILVTSQITGNYSTSNVQQYAGYVTEEENFGTESPEDYNDNYVVGVGSLPEFSDSQRALIHQGLWKSNFFTTRNNECYLPTSLEQAPGISDRIENKTRGSRSEGIYTILDNLDSSSSDIGYERKNSSDVNSVGIEGVSSGDGETWTDFSMGESLAIDTGLSKLIE